METENRRRVRRTPRTEAENAASHPRPQGAEPAPADHPSTGRSRGPAISPPRGGAQRVVAEILESADVRIGGDRPHDIQVHDPRFYRRVLASGSLGFGEAYVEGWWDADAVDETVYRLLRKRVTTRRHRSPRVLLLAAAAKLLNLQSPRRAAADVRGHYERGLDLYRAMLDEGMTYSCGYWRQAGTLDDAQEAKLDLICRKLGLQEGTHVLDIGCGWGSFARFAAERYGARVTGITLSLEQAELARERCSGLPVDIRVEDFRGVRGRFDAVVSIGMIEHVGADNYRDYMEVTARCLAPGGTSLIHTIAGGRSTHHIDPWVHRYVFPGANLPSLRQLAEAAEGLFVVEDVHNFGPDYDRTLLAWHDNFEAAWPDLRSSYDERFRRMWRFYLLACAAAFRSRRVQLYQVMLTPPGSPQPPGRREQ